MRNEDETDLSSNTEETMYSARSAAMGSEAVYLKNCFPQARELCN
jgi:hypothetical protein